MAKTGYYWDMLQLPCRACGGRGLTVSGESKQTVRERVKHGLCDVCRKKANLPIGGFQTA